MSLSDSEIGPRQELAISAAREAGRLTLQYFQREGLAVEQKSDRSPVTIADRESESLLRDRIAAKFPDDGILGEEFGEQAGTSPFRWILDPIDGTKSFISGVPLYGTLVGIEFEGQSAAGVIYIPPLDECVYATQGRGAWYCKGNDPPIPARVSDTDSLADGLVVTSSVNGFFERNAQQALEELQAAAWYTRTWGDCYGYLLVATGRAAVMIDPELNVWDAAAVAPILREAGGTFTDWQGNSRVDGGDGIGSNGLVNDEVLEITRKFAPQG